MTKRENPTSSTGSTGSTGSHDSTGPGSKKPPTAAKVLRTARDAFTELTGLTVDAVSSLQQTEDGGWLLHIEVVELARVPLTTSVMGSYEVAADPRGRITGYRRIGRYERGRAAPNTSPGPGGATAPG